MCPYRSRFFFFNDTATTEIYTLSLHDALPISAARWPPGPRQCRRTCGSGKAAARGGRPRPMARRRSEEHTSELQSHHDLVCRLLLEKKKNRKKNEQLTNKKSAHRYI